MTTLREFISKQIDLCDNEWALWEKIIKVKHFKKGEQITFKNDIWTDFIFVNSGLIRSYIINNEGKDYTWQFNFNTEESLLEHFFAVDYASIVQHIPSCRGFEVLEDSEVLIYSKKEFYDLCEEHKKYERVGRLIAQAAYLVIDNYYTRVFTENTADRYKYILEHMPNLVKKVPQYHIASYLGISPVSLSRIKTQLEQEKNKV